MNEALNIIEEAVLNEGFVVDDDAKAEWALRKIQEEKSETQRYINVCQTMINEYQLKIEQAKKFLESRTVYFTSQLQQYFEKVPHNATKTQKTYTLPSGKLVLKKQNPEYKKDEESLLKWLKSNGKTQFIEQKESPKWSILKDSVVVSGDKVVTEDGEIVEGVTVIERPDVFEIKF